MRYYNGLAPCPGCGVSGEEKTRPRKDELCRDCSALLKIGVKAKKAAEADRTEYVRVALARYSPNQFTWDILIEDKKGNRDYEKSILERDSEYRKGHIYISDSNREDVDGTSRKVMDEMVNFLSVISTKKHTEKTNISLRMDESSSGYGMVLEKDTAYAFFKFWKQVIAHERLIKEESYNEGKNLLMGLQTGKTTLQEINEKA